MNDVHHLFATSTHCQCGACFCSHAKLQAIDGRAICANCKPLYDQMIQEQITRNVESANQVIHSQ